MTQPLARGVVRVFRLTNESGGLGLSCTPTGVSLAGVPLLRKTQAGFVPRSASEIATLLRTAYGEDHADLQSRLRDKRQRCLRRGVEAAGCDRPGGEARFFT